MKEPVPYPGRPKWVKVLGIIALIAVLILLILLATRGPGGHGPGRHFQGSTAPEVQPADTPLAVERGVPRP